jgi:hypothetical protein
MSIEDRVDQFIAAALAAGETKEDIAHALEERLAAFHEADDGTSFRTTPTNSLDLDFMSRERYLSGT